MPAVMKMHHVFRLHTILQNVFSLTVSCHPPTSGPPWSGFNDILQENQHVFLCHVHYENIYRLEFTHSCCIPVDKYNSSSYTVLFF